MNALIDNIIEQSRGRFLTVTFRKKNGQLRTINGRIGVFHEGWPADYRYDAMQSEGRFFLIWSVRDRGFRRVNAESVVRIASQGTVIFTREPMEQAA